MIKNQNFTNTMQKFFLCVILLSIQYPENNKSEFIPDLTKEGKSSRSACCYSESSHRTAAKFGNEGKGNGCNDFTMMKRSVSVALISLHDIHILLPSLFGVIQRREKSTEITGSNKTIQLKSQASNSHWQSSSWSSTFCVLCTLTRKL